MRCMACVDRRFLRRCSMDAKKMRSWAGFLCAFFLAGWLLPAVAQTGCTQAMAEKLVFQNLDLRLRFLKNEELMPVYEAAVARQSAQVGQWIAAGQWDGVCQEIFGMMAAADDVLAGGDGRTKPLKTPWSKCTMEKMLSLENEYDLICLPERRVENCARRELTPLRRELIYLKAQAGKGDLKAARYVDRTCELYTDLLKILNE